MHFLMLGQAGRYRAPTMELAKLVYSRHARPNSLADLCGEDLATLEQQYKEWLRPDPSQFKFLTLAPQRTELALGFCPVDSSVGEVLGDCVNLNWLQLSRTRVDDRIGPYLERLVKLRQLFLDQTLVTDNVIPHLAGLANLEELDLAGSGVTDEGLRQIGQMKSLKVLWLGETKVSDAGMAFLSGLSSLEFLDTANTKVTEVGWQRLQSQLPHLKPIASQAAGRSPNLGQGPGK